MVLAAVKNNGLALKYASDNFKKDPTIVDAAINNDGCAICYVDAELLKKDHTILLKAVISNGKSLEHVFINSKLNKTYNLNLLVETNSRNRQVSINVANFNCYSTYHTSSRNNNSTVQIISYNSDLINYDDTNKYYENDFAFKITIEAVKQNGISLLHAHEQLKHNKEIVMEAVKNNGLAILCAP